MNSKQHTETTRRKTFALCARLAVELIDMCTLCAICVYARIGGARGGGLKVEHAAREHAANAVPYGKYKQHLSTSTTTTHRNYMHCTLVINLWSIETHAEPPPPPQTDSQTDRQTDRQTNEHAHSHLSFGMDTFARALMCVCVVCACVQRCRAQI